MIKALRDAGMIDRSLQVGGNQSKKGREHILQAFPFRQLIVLKLCALLKKSTSIRPREMDSNHRFIHLP
jgi:hypothetical protein